MTELFVTQSQRACRDCTYLVACGSEGSGHLILFFYPLQSMSGIEIDPEIVTLFNEMKLRSTHKWATFKIENKKKIILDETGDPCSTESKEEDRKWFDELKAKLTKEPRYILYDFGFTLKDGRILKKLAFIFW